MEALQKVTNHSILANIIAFSPEQKLIIFALHLKLSVTSELIIQYPHIDALELQQVRTELRQHLKFLNRERNIQTKRELVQRYP